MKTVSNFKNNLKFRVSEESFEEGIEQNYFKLLFLESELQEQEEMMRWKKTDLAKKLEKADFY